MTTFKNPSTTNKRSLALIFLAWVLLQLGGLFSPGLLDDVDSIYIQIGREMLQRHDFVTPTIDGIRFFDKPPLMYWLAAGSMKLFGVHDWAGRLPLALGVLALLFATYALANHFFRAISPAEAPDRAGLYAALAMATSVGPYLYTRFFIPDMLVTLWMVLSVYLFLVAIDRVTDNTPERPQSAWLPMLGFGVVLALSLLTKGLIGIVFPVAFAALYLVLTRQLRLLPRLCLPGSLATFLLVALPWHILAALRNPAIAMPAGVGLPPRAGWAWFYLYNEHFARFLGKRIPHDYGNVPRPLFWLLLFLWLLPWAAFLPAAIRDAIATLRATPLSTPLRFDSDPNAGPFPNAAARDRSHEAAIALLLWAGIVLGFFTLSYRQEYYHLPALPALAILVAGLLAAADRKPLTRDEFVATLFANPTRAARQVLFAARWFLLPFGTVLFLICGYFAITAPTPGPGQTVSLLLTQNPEKYDLSLGHVYDLTGAAMGFFRGPLITVALGMLALGPIAYFIRRRGRNYAATLTIAGGMTAVLLAAHSGIERFYPILGSKELALEIEHRRHPGDKLMIDGWMTWGSTLIFYTGQQVSLVNGHIYGPWFGSFWPDSPKIFEDDDSLHRLWTQPQRIFLLSFDAKRITDLQRFGPVYILASDGGKWVLSNQPDRR